MHKIWFLTGRGDVGRGLRICELYLAGWPNLPVAHRIEAMVDLSDQDIRLRLTNVEDSTVERKTANDYRDCLKTAVAFSNSLPLDDPGLIFVGLRDDGTVEDDLNLEKLQKNVSKEVSKIYPTIFPQYKTMKDAVGKEFLVVIVRGSGSRPHFAGPSYIRDGTQTIEASEQQFERLIAERNSKVREILKWLGKSITIWMPGMTKSRHPSTGGKGTQMLVDCNQFYVTVRSGETLRAFVLSEVDIGYDFDNQCLELRFIG
jgi:hypothetical protein